MACKAFRLGAVDNAVSGIEEPSQLKGSGYASNSEPPLVKKIR
eukprot:CAMPEP_0198213014 /NCGR_PEP_ID=MMETSP1445-20131203/28628_1 /TAXON_ID=36898 /ORGANISM="Pyramimonas sp., Strain CCMP2087" /LENGTH=42 /DNA_ID= /DNA_START= /DNA_END= /DNA_ORIENTATION=